MSSPAEPDIASRLDIVIALLAATYVRDLNNSDAIVKLSKLKLSREVIADAVGVTPHNVSQVLYASKKPAVTSKGKKAEPGGDSEVSKK